MEKTVPESLRSHLVTLDQASGFLSRTARAPRESWSPVDLPPIEGDAAGAPIAEEDPSRGCWRSDDLSCVLDVGEQPI